MFKLWTWKWIFSCNGPDSIFTQAWHLSHCSRFISGIWNGHLSACWTCLNHFCSFLHHVWVDLTDQLRLRQFTDIIIQDFWKLVSFNFKQSTPERWLLSASLTEHMTFTSETGAVSCVHGTNMLRNNQETLLKHSSSRFFCPHEKCLAFMCWHQREKVNSIYWQTELGFWNVTLICVLCAFPCVNMPFDFYPRLKNNAHFYTI